MAKINEAVENVRSLARTFGAVQQLAEALDEVGSLENAVAERKGILAGLDKDIEAARTEVANAKADVAVAKKKAADIVDKAEAEATELKNTALEKMADAESSAARAIADADTYKAQVETLCSHNIDSADAKVKVKQAELADLESRIARAKSSISKIIGGAG